MDKCFFTPLKICQDVHLPHPRIDVLGMFLENRRKTLQSSPGLRQSPEQRRLILEIRNVGRIDRKCVRDRAQRLFESAEGLKCTRPVVVQLRIPGAFFKRPIKVRERFFPCTSLEGGDTPLLRGRSV